MQRSKEIPINLKFQFDSSTHHFKQLSWETERGSARGQDKVKAYHVIKPMAFAKSRESIPVKNLKLLSSVELARFSFFVAPSVRPRLSSKSDGNCLWAIGQPATLIQHGH